MTGTSGTQRATRNDRWTLRIMNNPSAAHLYEKRSQRRRIVTAHIVLSGLAVSGMVLASATGQLWWTVALVGALALWIPLTGLLNAMTRGLLELRTHMLDERQLDERGTIHTLAHRVSFLAMLIAFGGIAVAYRYGATLTDLATPIAATALGLLVLHWLLPLWIAALRVQDEPPEDD